MDQPDPSLRAALVTAIAGAARAREGLFLAGLCGAQGCGKSTLARAAVSDLAAQGLPAAVMALDDLYRTRAARAALARAVHPLLATRGVPGTHDLALAHAAIAALERGEPATLPRFDKASDDRLPAVQAQVIPAGTRVVLFEGWCVGARPQADAALAEPVNDLERREDAQGIWRRHVNTALARDYQPLFARVDWLALLAAPGFGVVADWRWQQERDRQGGAMDRAAVTRFVAHYERLTRHILAEMPPRAQFVAHLGPDRRPRSIKSAPATP